MRNRHFSVNRAKEDCLKRTESLRLAHLNISTSIRGTMLSKLFHAAGGLDARQPVLYIASSISGHWERKRVRKRAMKVQHSRFAFTYRFSYGEERAGETRADRQSK